jgi:hypothetical protein
MRLGWSIPLPGPFRLSGTIWRSQRRRGPVYHGTLPGWACPHAHRRLDTAEACARREAMRRLRGAGNNGPVSTAQASSFLNTAGTMGG